MILVTGATGFVGSYLVKKLSQGGQEIRCLVRKNSDTSKLKNYKVELAYGNLEDKASLRKAVKNTNTIIHLAGITKTLDVTLFKRVNIFGIQNLLDVCVAEKIKKFIFLSSDDALYPNDGMYARSKFEAEQLIQKSPLDFTILRSTVIYGEDDTKNIATLISIIKRFPIIPVIGNDKYRIQPVYVEDVVSAIINVMQNSSSKGKTYNIAGLYPITFNELIDTICYELQVRRVKVCLPIFMIKSIIGLYEKISAQPYVSLIQISNIMRNVTYDIQSAMTDFGYSPHTFQEGIRKMFKEKV